jgi:phenylacetate-CoA ligase
VTIYEPRDLVRIAKEKSPFYRKLYEKVDPKSCRIEDLPLISQADFWDANTIRNNQVLTGPLHDGFVFKSGGTSGKPKFSAFTAEEWKTFTEAFGRGMADGKGVEDGDRIGNLFYAGDLYASFIFIMDSMSRSGVQALQLPLGGHCSFESIGQTILDFDLTTLAGVPTTMLNLAREMTKKAVRFPQIKKILYGGESCYPDQLVLLGEVFPNAKVQSVGYASVDAGLLGYFGNGCQFGEHKSFAKETIFEILDQETSEQVSSVGKSGKLYITNLTRTLMPIIRYPVGDVVEWVGSKDSGIFKILGRSEEGVRVGPVSIALDDLRKAISEADGDKTIANFQCVLEHFDSLDQLTLRIFVVKGVSKAKEFVDEIERHIEKARPFLGEAIRDKKLHPLKVEVLDAARIEINPRTGKMIPLIDKRLAGK